MTVFDLMKDVVPIKIAIKERIDGKFLIVEGADLQLYFLNKTSAFFLSCVDGKKTVGEIVRLMFDKFDVNEEKLRDDVVALVRNLQGQRVLRLEAYHG